MAENKQHDLDMDLTESPEAFFQKLIPMRDKTWEEMIERYREKGYDIADTGAAGHAPRLIIYPKREGEKRGALIICAGGAFLFKSWNEAEPVADYFYGQGFETAILDYRVQPFTDVESAEDGHWAVRYLRVHADQYGIDPDHIALGGFSAGGMLSNLAAVTCTAGDPDAEDPLLRVSSRPDAVVVGYGAFVSTYNVGGLMHDAAKQNALARTAPECLLGPDAPPYFMFQTDSDDPRNMTLFQLRLAQLGIPFEAHMFAGGFHGNGLYNGKDETEDNPHTAHWAELCAEWLKKQGF